MSKTKLLIFQIFALMACLIIAAAVGIILLQTAYEQSSTEELVLKQEFHRYIVDGDHEMVKKMIADHPKLVNLPLAKNSHEYAESVNDDTPLIAAKADLKMVRLLLDNGANVNQATPISHRYPLTAILASGANERFDIAWLYISKGADVNCEDYVNGTVPYAILSCEGIIQLNLQNSAAELMEYMVKKGVSLDMPERPSSVYNSLLGLAAQNNYYKVIQYFAKAKLFDFNAKVTADNKTALMIAAKYGNYGATNHLVFYGAREHFKDDYGKTAYDYAKISGDERTINYLA